MVPGLEEAIRRRGISDLKWIRDFCRPHADDAPNTYTFTKNIAEVLVKVVSEQEGFQSVIIRPPVVCAPSREPEPGFVDDPRQGLVSFALSVYLGVIVMFVYDGSKRFVYNTVDVIVNAILVSACDIAKDRGCRFRVVNACRSGETFNELIEKIIESGQKYPSLSTLRPLHVFQCTTNGLTTRIQKLFYHYMFALLVDTTLLLTGRKALLVLGSRGYSSGTMFFLTLFLSSLSFRDSECTHRSPSWKNFKEWGQKFSSSLTVKWKKRNSRRCDPVSHRKIGSDSSWCRKD